MTSSTALVGPVSTVRFQDGTRQAYDVPRDTLDPRWQACAEHRVACDCREAELNEDRTEYRAMYQAVVDAAAEVLAGHPTHAEPGCACTGCRIVRAAHVPLRWANGGPS